MTTLIQYASLICVTAGLVCGVLVLGTTRDLRTALRTALDFWLAAGLLRLALPNSATQLLAIVAIIAVRQLVSRALSAHPRPAPDTAQGRQ
ncbi:hypothetical protein ACGFJ7_21700 [Actinoplanes sp. NPDC048988]|uniref:hypothetical protein n=1 Tax=Actinoplanes sp. NPDC048988 TaxID=3363901 RepID=UPI00371E5C03